MKKKLWDIFGPVLLAAIILGILLVLPFNLKTKDSLVLREAALSQSKNVFKGEELKQTALEKGYVPFFGSSELSRMDPMHPSVLAQKYHRTYRPFLLGGPGSQSLSQYFGLQEINGQMKHKKAVFIISPQWFVKQGANPLAFSLYYSNLQAVDFALQAQNTKADRFAAKRLLAMNVGESSFIQNGILDRLAQGKQLTKMQRTYLKLKQQQLRHEDQLFSSLRLNGRRSLKIDKASKKLPAKYNYDELDQLAARFGQKATSNNDLGIDNKFWKKRIAKNLAKAKDSQVNFNYTQSVEFADFQLVLNQFAKDNTDVYFVIPPVNRKWSNYTGLSLSMLKQFDKKISYQLRSQGFNNIIDLSDDGNEKYLMQDTIHLGWRGWLKVDQKIGPFLENKQQVQPKYQLNNYFYSKNWQNLHGKALNAKVD